MAIRIISIHRESVPESCMHNLALTISSKDSEYELECDLVSVLMDALFENFKFRDVKIVDERVNRDVK